MGCWILPCCTCQELWPGSGAENFAVLLVAEHFPPCSCSCSQRSFLQDAGEGNRVMLLPLGNWEHCQRFPTSTTWHSPVHLPREKTWTPQRSWLSLLLMSTLSFTWETWKITKEGQRLGKRVELRQCETTGSRARFILLDLYQLFRPDSRSCSYNSRWQTLQLGSSSEPAWELYHPGPVRGCSLFASQGNSD